VLVICDGMPRSASTWSFNVVLALLRRSQPIAEVHGGYDEDIAHFLASTPSTAKHAVVKCHKLDPCGRALAQTGAAKLIYTWRDPADAAVSCMRMFGYDFEGALAIVDSSLELYHFHRRSGAALILDYAQVATASIEAVRRIAAHLALDDSEETIHAVTEQTSLERVKEHVGSLADNPRLVHDGPHEYDSETLLHRGHIRDGSVGYGRGALTAEQSEQVDALLLKHGLAREHKRLTRTRLTRAVHTLFRT
jgi:hypothetical protein